MALLLPGQVATAVVVAITGAVATAVLCRWMVVGWLVPVVALGAVSGVVALSTTLVGASPVAELAASRAVVEVELQVTSDARRTQGRFGEVVVVRARTGAVSGRGTSWDVQVPVVVIARGDWPTPELGSILRTSARLAPADDGAAALVMPLGSPRLVRPPSPWWDGAAAVRSSVRRVVADRGVHERELVPALVDGDDSGIDPALADDFRTSGLTHLLAVSGTNLTLVVGFLVVLGRWVGVRGRGTYALAAAGIIGFVLLARTEPSVVRAAAMGTAALLGMGSNGLSRGVRCLGAAVLGLLLVDPRLALTAGFALSVLATGGILLLAPRWRDALARWMPRWCAEAVAIPLAAQVACTPVVAGISGEVSLVAVAANLLVAPAVAPATVLGLAGGLAGLVWLPLGEVVAAPGAWSVGWIVRVARWSAAAPMAAVSWGTGPTAITALTVLCLASVVAAPRVLCHPVPAVLVAGVVALAVLVRPPALGWPPEPWLVAMCDVGQGDALVLRAGPASGVVVDAGPDPAAVDRCLHDLGVTQVPLVVLTHFHADHVDGLAGVLSGRDVGGVEATGTLDPASGVAGVRSAWGADPAVSPYAMTRQVGDVVLQVLWPEGGSASGGVGLVADGDLANDASVVLLARVRGVAVLLTGDVEPPAQARLRALTTGLVVDVLKVPHHGSRHQDLGWLTSLGADVALVSVGRDNDYGHPSAEVVSALERAGAEVWRTDQSGDVVVVERGEGFGVTGRD